MTAAPVHWSSHSVGILSGWKAAKIIHLEGTESFVRNCLLVALRPAGLGTFAGPPGGFPETFNGDSALPPNFLMQAFSYMTFFEARHPEGGFVNWLPHRLAEQWVVPYIERESPLLAQ